tara:strand:+ start:125 stop:676 length:552 start_codon:yes stop_codon:yes gene_type:complete
MEVNMTEKTENTGEDGFTIFRRARTSSSGPRRERYTNKNRRSERMNLLHQVANGTMEPEVAARHLNRTYAQPTQRFHHTVTRDGRINISGVVPGQSLTLMVDEWTRLASYLGGKNFRRFVERNSERLRTRRGPYTGSTGSTTETSTTEEGTSTEPSLLEGVEVVQEAVSAPTTDVFEVQTSGI